MIDGLAERLMRTLSPGSVADQNACAMHAVQGVTPDLVVRPSSVEEVSAILRIANEAHAAVTPWGGGVHQSLGYPPPRIVLLLSLARIRRVLAYEPPDLVVSAQAGASVAEIGSLLAGHGQMLPIDPWQPDRASLGGVIAANVAGPRRLRHGTCRDCLIGAKVVHADGTITKSGGMVVKNVSGYDLPKLYLGSLGTLAVIVEANFKLTPVPPITRMVRFEHCPLVSSLSLADGVVRSALNVASVVLAGGDSDTVTVSVLCEGTAPVVDRQERDLRTTADAIGLPPPQCLDLELASDALRLIAEFGWKEESAETEALIRLHTLPDQLGHVLRHTRAFTRELGLTGTWVAHAGVACVLLAIDGSGCADFPAALAALQHSLIEHWSRSVIARCPPRMKERLDMWGATPPGIARMRRIKAAFDPNGILNSGRYLRELDS